NKNLLNKKITIIGLKKSGYAATILGHELGANIFVSEIDNDLEIITNKNNLIKKGIDVETGNHSKLVYDADFWVISPGVPNDIEIIKQAKALNIPIIGEIEFASRFTSTPIIAVTGSNGKSTTVNILYSMLKTDKLQPILAGNIGIPFSEKVFEELKNPDLGNIYILEISSFQLEFIEQFRAMICVYLNISPDHLDRHENMDKYLKIKLKMIKNHKEDDTVVYNIDDPVLDIAFNDYLLEKIPFSISNQTPFFGVNETKIYNENNEPYVFIDDIILKGKHNLSNLLASATVAKLMNVDDKIIINTMKNFSGIDHRLQIIKEINEVTYVNDSKATNIHSVIVAINSFETPIILLLGGKNKNSDFRLLLPHTKRHVKHIVSYGEAGGEIAAAIGDAVRLNCVSSLSEAVASAHNLASPGDIVLMSPGCASFDQFNNFEERGEKFISLVNNLIEKI
ncbi:MAG: UDP-N-acetylmuramoyl-L-alanine--D-glutamate ligase, partial [Candidatus Neomarinimicrobiota bacterium]|nr:UDP-N-acetylmuramoyl-L-alanine--D-glutamate ligase [Candidatus Neomarinimicrobiota bacterium]